MSDTNLKSRTVKGFFWRLAERFGTQGIGFVVSLVLARLLGPDAYGTLALLTIFIALSNVFVDCGFGTALVRKKDATDLDFNSVFYLSLSVAAVFYGILYVSAPWIADFYRRPVLVPLLRVLAFSVIINSVNGVQNAVLARGLLFNLSFRIGLVQTVTTGLVGIASAYAGLGVWALVWGTLGGGLAGTAVRWFLIGWRPRFMFSFDALHGLFSFSWKLLCSALLDTFFVNLYGLVIGRVYTPSDLAFYNRGRNFPQTAMDAVNGSLTSVMFPAFSKLQDDRMRLRNAVRKSLLLSTFAIFPLMALLAAVAEPLIRFLLGEAWLPAVPFMQIACVIFALWPVHTINLQVLTALGRSDIFLKLEILKKIMSVSVLFFSIRHGVLFLACMELVVSSPISAFLNSHPNGRLVGYGTRRQVRDLLPMFLWNALIGLGVACLPPLLDRLGSASAFLCLAVQGLAGALAWSALVLLWRPEAGRILLEQIPPAWRGKIPFPKAKKPS